MARKEKGFTDAAPAARGGFHSPFAALGGLRETLPAAPAPEAPAPVDAAPDGDPRGPARAVVRLERKGRGGKDATVITHLELTEAALGEWLLALKSRLGCGGAVEEGSLVLHGDQRERVIPLLEARGVRRVTRG